MNVSQSAGEWLDYRPRESADSVSQSLHNPKRSQSQPQAQSERLQGGVQHAHIGPREEAGQREDPDIPVHEEPARVSVEAADAPAHLSVNF